MNSLSEISDPDSTGSDPSPSSLRRHHQLALRSVSHVALARYHVVRHPRDPFRLPRLLLTTNSLVSTVRQEDVVAAFFAGDARVILFVMNKLMQP